MVEESQSVKAGDVLARIEGPPCPQAAAAEDTADFNYFGTLLKPVGIGEKAAKKQGIDVEVGKFPFAASGKALTMGESRGFVKIIKQKCTGKILGGAIIGPHATDLIAEIALAVKKGLTCEDVIETVHAHPTTAEAIHEAVLAAEGGAIHFVN
jgi:dihydrolipoamide dehydrogenase